MKQTLLIDLDDTLLSNPVEKFMPAYINSLAKALENEVKPQILVSALLRATNKMIEKNSSINTLESEFDSYFYDDLGISKTILLPIIDHFYQNEYQLLQNLTSPRPEAIKLIESAFSNGYTVVVATNPLFPEIAIKSRLAWANLPLEKYPFSIVTTYEYFHFSKPNSAYYAEILAQLGWPDQPVCMVGDSYNDDILPCQELGIPTFLINQNGLLQVGKKQGTFSGRLSQIENWIPGSAGHVQFSSMKSLTALLNSTPAAVETLLKNISQSPMDRQIAVCEILKEMQNLERNEFLPMLFKINQDNSSFVKEAANITQFGSSDESIHEILIDFLRLRPFINENLQKLDQKYIQLNRYFFSRVVQSDQAFIGKIFRLMKSSKTSTVQQV